MAANAAVGLPYKLLTFVFSPPLFVVHHHSLVADMSPAPTRPIAILGDPVIRPIKYERVEKKELNERVVNLHNQHFGFASAEHKVLVQSKKKLVPSKKKLVPSKKKKKCCDIKCIGDARSAKITRSAAVINHAPPAAAAAVNNSTIPLPAAGDDDVPPPWALQIKEGLHEMKVNIEKHLTNIENHLTNIENHLVSIENHVGVVEGFFRNNERVISINR